MIDVGLIVQDSEEVPKGMMSYFEFHNEEGHEISKARKDETSSPQRKDQKEGLQGQSPGSDYFMERRTWLALQKRARISVSTCVVGGTMTLKEDPSAQNIQNYEDGQLVGRKEVLPGRGFEKYLQ
ncbi:hypothetical protein GOBAR_DD10520 [Gossypium barbadense]|nr:hypothetical protein GOBAR_DD10520 [Gossypium barbadense]